MATVTERKPGVWLARAFLPPSADSPGRQVAKTFRGSKKVVRAEVAVWEADLRGRPPVTSTRSVSTHGSDSSVAAASEPVPYGAGCRR